MTDTTEYANRCECGWEVTGSLDEVVDATIEHGRRIHNMEATRDRVIAAVVAGSQSDEPADLTA